MNKVLNSIKVILFVCLFIFNIIYLKIFFAPLPLYCLYLLLFIIFGGLLIRDLVRHANINDNKIYNGLCILVFLLVIFIHGRTLIDPNFLYNSSYHLDLIEKAISLNSKYYYSDYLANIKETNVHFILENCYYFIILFSLLLIYRKLNVEKLESKYHIISLVCFFISILSIGPTIAVLSGANAIVYLVFTCCLVGVEIYRLIKDNHKKYQWIIFMSFLFNLFAFISIFINLYFIGIN